MMIKKIGILGGGQLGRMFLQAAYDYPFEYHMIDPTDNAPCASVCQNFQVGHFDDYDTVLQFAEPLDVIGIEIEHVNTEALVVLEAQGKTVIPSPNVLSIIKDKGRQKDFYRQQNIKTPDYYLIEGKSDVDIEKINYPFVQKLRTGGYDGKGVQVIRQASELNQLWDEPSVIEAFTPIDKEIAVMVICNQQGETVVYPCVEMVFDAELNLVDYLFSPAQLSTQQQETATTLALNVVKSFASAGVFAVELFVDQQGEIWVNETAPRVHNSGHHTIEAAYSSQFDQMLRVLADLPLGASSLRENAAMINLIGANGHRGEAVIKGLDSLAMMEKTYLHWYGKSQTSPGRKMGHITVLGETNEIQEKLAIIKQTVSVVSR